MDNTNTTNTQKIKALSNFLGMGEGYEKIFIIENIKDALAFLKNMEVTDAQRKYLINRLLKIYSIDPDLKGFLDCLELIFEQVKNRRNEFGGIKHELLKKVVNNLVMRLDHNDIVEILILVNTPPEHVFHNLVDNSMLEAMIRRTLPTLIQGFSEPQKLIIFMNKYLTKQSGSKINVDLMTNQLESLLQRVYNFEELNGYKTNVSEKVIGGIIDKRITDLVISSYRNASSITILLNGLSMIESYEEGAKLIRKEEAGYIEKIQKIFDLRVFLEEYSKFSEHNSVCYQHLISQARWHACNLVEKININSVDDWFYYYIESPNMIPSFLFDKFIKKAEEILNK
jgi:hypothetical protein